MLRLQRKLDPKKGRIVRKIEVPTDTPTEVELEDTAADIQWRREERDAREKEEEAQKPREEARREKITHSKEEGVAEKHASTDRSNRNGHACWRRDGHISIAL